LNREETLAFAEELLHWGIPVILCKPRPGSDEVVPVVSWRNITNAAQCREMLEAYEHGTDALAMIGGYGIDLIDVDTKAGGSIDPFGDFKHYGITTTPSGGRHYVITSTGLRRIQGLEIDGEVVGDYIGGTIGHESRMLGFLPGSHRPKYGDVQYTMASPWDIEGAVLGEVDERLKEILESALDREPSSEVYIDLSPERDPDLGLHPYAAGAIAEEIQRLKDLPRPWHPGAYWDNTTFEVACNLVRWANSGWTGYSIEDAEKDLLEFAPADEAWGEREHRAKWRGAREAVGSGGRRDPDDPANDFDVEPAPVVKAKAGVDVTSSADAFDWVVRMLGTEGTALAGLFHRGGDLVYTPRVGEAGYKEPDGKDEDGFTQVKRMSSIGLCAYVEKNYRVYKMVRGGGSAASLFPEAVASRAVVAPELLDGLRTLHAVTHTPLIRQDGSVLRTPGYDMESGILFLPDRGLKMPRADSGGLALVEEMIEGFPFVTEHDKANYIAALLTPLLRQMVPPPYPLLAIGAPQPGSGKSLLARVLRILHGGVFRAEMVREATEFRKQITSILDSTTAPVVTFDNMNGTLRSPVFEGLVTSREWSDRILGLGQSRTLPNDRLWTITGNNLSLGGDLRRRTVWVTIDPKMSAPETRTGFKHQDLPEWVEENRGEILAALLGMVTRWVEAGRLMDAQERTDDFGVWQRVLGGILAANGVSGRLNDPETVQAAGLEEEDEWGSFLLAVRGVYGYDRWQVRGLVDGLGMEGGVPAEAVPSEVLDKMRYNSASGAKSLGRWVQTRAGRHVGADEMTVAPAGADRNKVRYWRVTDNNSAGVL
jgi:hypothetical protein